MLVSLSEWLVRNKRMASAVVLGLFGVVRLAQGLPGLLSWPVRPESGDLPWPGLAIEQAREAGHHDSVNLAIRACARSPSVVQRPIVTGQANEPPP